MSSSDTAVDDDIITKIASENDEFKLVDSEGYVFWVDQYDGFGAYIHSDEGDSYYISLPQLKEFEFNNV